MTGTADSEEWRQVDGWPWYEVSNQGRVRSLQRYVDFIDGRRQLRPSVVLRGGFSTRSPYQTVVLMGHGRRKTYQVHHLVCTAFHGPRPVRQECRHLDGNPRNNRADNLKWGTPIENSQDQIKHGTLRGLKQWTCSRGHMLAMPNLQVRAFLRGERVCRACHAAQSTVHYQKKTYGRVLDVEVVAARKYLEILKEVLRDDEGSAA